MNRPMPFSMPHGFAPLLDTRDKLALEFLKLILSGEPSGRTFPRPHDPVTRGGPSNAAHHVRLAYEWADAFIAQKEPAP